MHHQNRRLRAAILVSSPFILALVPACDHGDGGGDEACFDVPSGPRRAAPEIPIQGTSLQGGKRPDIETQGTSLQGGGRPDMETQGTSLQGGGRPEIETQGTSLQGSPRAERSAFVGIDDLNGARLGLPGDSRAVALVDGRLVVDGAAESTFAGEVSVVTRDGRTFIAEVTELESLGRGPRFAVSVDGISLCENGDAGAFVMGHWDETGAHEIDSDELTFACANGVIAKCVDWGYAPWSVGADVHQGCTRLARADYCGDGRPWTLDGTAVDIYDEIGVRTAVGDPMLAFEAGWDADGAVCASAMRYIIEDGDGQEVQPSCLAELPRCTSLVEAADLGAVLVNDSAHTSIPACE